MNFHVSFLLHLIWGGIHSIEWGILLDCIFPPPLPINLKLWIPWKPFFSPHCYITKNLLTKKKVIWGRVLSMSFLWGASYTGLPRYLENQEKSRNLKIGQKVREFRKIDWLAIAKHANFNVGSSMYLIQSWDHIHVILFQEFAEMCQLLNAKCSSEWKSEEEKT